MEKEQKKYGYARVSTKQQHEDRQVEKLLNEGIPKDRIFVDKQTGRNFNRQEYQTIKRFLKDSPNSLFVVDSIDRLGRNYSEIKEEWRSITKECQADIQVLDMALLDTRLHKDLLGTFISDLVLQVLSFVAQQQVDKSKRDQAEGIATAKAQGKHLGRPRAEITDNFIDIWQKWKNGEFETTVQAIKESGTKKTTFYKFSKILEEKAIKGDLK